MFYLTLQLALVFVELWSPMAVLMGASQTYLWANSYIHNSYIHAASQMPFFFFFFNAAEFLFPSFGIFSVQSAPELGVLASFADNWDWVNTSEEFKLSFSWWKVGVISGRDESRYISCPTLAVSSDKRAEDDMLRGRCCTVIVGSHP